MRHFNIFEIKFLYLFCTYVFDVKKLPPSITDEGSRQNFVLERCKGTKNIPNNLILCSCQRRKSF